MRVGRVYPLEPSFGFGDGLAVQRRSGVVGWRLILGNVDGWITNWLGENGQRLWFDERFRGPLTTPSAMKLREAPLRMTGFRTIKKIMQEV